MGAQEYPKKMWSLLQECYRAATSFIRAAAHSTATQTKYPGQKINNCDAKYESCAAQLVSMNASIDECLLFTIFVEPFRERAKSPYREAFSALFTKHELF